MSVEARVRDGRVPVSRARISRGMEEALREIIAGTVAGVTGIAATQPLDVIRVHMQAAGHSVTALWRATGVRGMFAGLTAPVLANAPINATIFAVERAVIRRFDAATLMTHPVAAHSVAGAVAGLAQVPFSIPAELIKLQMQLMPTSSSQRASVWRHARGLVAAGGIRGLYRGGVLTTARDTSAFAIYFGTYHALKGWFALQERGAESLTDATFAPLYAGSTESASNVSQHTPVVSTFALMMAGGTAGVASWLFTYPLDVLKTHVQVAPTRISAVDVFRREWGAHGHAFLLRGLLPTCARAFPCSAITFPVFEAVLQALSSPHPREHQDDMHSH